MPFYRRPVVLFVLALVYLACGTWSLPLIDRDEPRFAEATREMSQGGDYVVPYFNAGYRFDKPPLTYWTQVASCAVFGESDFAVRFPSVVAGALTVLLVCGFATRLFDRETGWVAALIFATCLQTFMHAKGAVADMLMVLFFTLTTWAGWELIQGAKQKALQPWRWWFVFYTALALGFLAKGPVAWLPLAAIGWYGGTRGPTGMGRRFQVGLGLLLTLALVGAWGVPALIRTHGAFATVGLGKHVVGRSFTAMEGHGAAGFASYAALLPMYFVTVFLSFFPWSIRLPWLVRRLNRFTREQRVPDDYAYLLAGVAVVFAVFTLVRTKLPHYTLPAFPLLAIVLARELVLARSAPDGKPSLNVNRWVAVTLAVGLLISLAVFPLLAPFFPGYTLIRQARSALKPEMEFASASYQEPSLVWYARSVVKGWYSPMNADELPAFMERNGPRFCVAPAGTVKAKPGWQVFETRGFNVVHWKASELELVVKPR